MSGLPRNREPWGNLSRGVQAAVIGLFTLIILIDAGIIALGYWADGWRGAACLAAYLLMDSNIKRTWRA